MSEEGKDIHPSHHHLLHRREEQPPQYGTFQGVANYPQPVIGFPQPVPPPGATNAPPHFYAHGYQAVPGASPFSMLVFSGGYYYYFAWIILIVDQEQWLKDFGENSS